MHTADHVYSFSQPQIEYFTITPITFTSKRNFTCFRIKLILCPTLKSQWNWSTTQVKHREKFLTNPSNKMEVSHSWHAQELPAVWLWLVSRRLGWRPEPSLTLSVTWEDWTDPAGTLLSLKTCCHQNQISLLHLKEGKRFPLGHSVLLSSCLTWWLPVPIEKLVGLCSTLKKNPQHTTPPPKKTKPPHCFFL